MKTQFNNFSRIRDNKLSKRLLFLFNIINYYYKEGLQPMSRVLEIGCGNGLVTNYLLNSTSSKEIVAVDIDGGAIANVREDLHDQESFKRCSLILDDFSRPSFDYGKFDLILLLDVLEHLEDLETVFQNIRTACNEDTMIIINIPNPEFIRALNVNNIKLQSIDNEVRFMTIYHSLYCKNLKLVQFMTYGIEYHNQYNLYVFKIQKEFEMLELNFEGELKCQMERKK